MKLGRKKLAFLILGALELTFLLTGCRVGEPNSLATNDSQQQIAPNVPSSKGPTSPPGVKGPSAPPPGATNFPPPGATSAPSTPLLIY